MCRKQPTAELVECGSDHRTSNCSLQFSLEPTGTICWCFLHQLIRPDLLQNQEPKTIASFKNTFTDCLCTTTTDLFISTQRKHISCKEFYFTTKTLKKQILYNPTLRKADMRLKTQGTWWIQFIISALQAKIQFFNTTGCLRFFSGANQTVKITPALN